MTHTLIVRLPQDAKSSVIWAMFADDTREVVEEGALAPDQQFMFRGAKTPERTWVLVPGTAVTVKSIEIPNMNDVRAREVVSFALEDDVAENRENLHYALGKRNSNRRLVGFTSQNEMETWLRTLSAMAVTPNVIVPEFLTCVDHTDSMVLVEYNGLIIGRFVDSGFSIEREIFAHLAADLLPPTGPIKIFSDKSSDLLPSEILESERLTSAPALGAKELFHVAYGTLSDGALVNLLQGKYAPRRVWTLPGKHWLRAAILAGVAVALSIALQIVDGVRFSREADAAYLRADAMFREVMPEGTRLVNARTQMRAHADKLDAVASNMFLRVSGLLYAGVSAVEGVEIDSLRFDSTRGALTASLSLPSFDAVERIARVVSTAGGLTQEGGARQQGERITADITVRAQ